jgi:hypothetical protein
MASFLTGVGCNSVACKVVEGLLNAAGVAFSDLKACEADLKTAVSGFTYGAQQIGDKKYITGIKSWGAALNTVSKAVADCGIENEFKYLEQEANVLGYGNVSTAMGNDVAILMHGVDFYQELYSALVSWDSRRELQAAATAHRGDIASGSKEGGYACFKSLAKPHEFCVRRGLDRSERNG